jgi:hypothetical protein
MTIVLLAAVTIAIGLLIGRWWVVGAAGIVAAATTLLAVSTWGAGDSPFLFVGVQTILGTSIGVLARRRLRTAG